MMNRGPGCRSEAQRQADRIRILREELQELERQKVLELSPEQREKPLYRFRLRYGRLLEPSVAGVDFVD